MRSQKVKTTLMTLKIYMVLLGVWLPTCVSVAADSKTVPYESPYRIQYTIPVEELIEDLIQGPRGEVKRLSSIPFDDWYTSKVKTRWGAWGPPFAHMPPPNGIESRSADFKRERVIAAGMRYVGISYQHHHLPDWDPPDDWPWKEVGRGENCKGIDCSNFTAFIYNQALGLKPTSAIREQAEQFEIPFSDGKILRAEKIERPKSYDAFSKELKTGDLLFVQNASKSISHVVLWIGSIGHSPDNVPLILDSTGEGRKDSNGQSIPDGVQLRPFTKSSWYYKSSAHAMRLIP